MITTRMIHFHCVQTRFTQPTKPEAQMLEIVDRTPDVMNRLAKPMVCGSSNRMCNCLCCAHRPAGPSGAREQTQRGVSRSTQYFFQYMSLDQSQKIASLGSPTLSRASLRVPRRSPFVRENFFHCFGNSGDVCFWGFGSMAFYDTEDRISCK